MSQSVTLLLEVTSKSNFSIMVFVKEKSKILYSHHKRIILSSFSGTFSNRHKISYGALPTDSSNVYFFLPSTTDRVEDINRYMGPVILSPIDIVESSFETEEGVSFDPSKLDTSCSEKKTITVAVIKMLKKIIDLSNSNLVSNANGLLSKKRSSDEDSIEWIGKTKKKNPREFKISY